MPKITVCFPGGRHKALTLSYDDGTLADRRLVDILNRNGLKGTFHLNSGLFGTGNRIGAAEARTLYQGHEVSAHTLTHPTIARCPQEAVVHEVLEDRKNLERLLRYTVRGMSYPNGSFNRSIKETLPALGIEYSRVVPSTGGFGMPDDWYEWMPTCHHKDNLMGQAETFMALNKTQYLYLMYVWGHSYEFDNDDNWDVIERFAEYAGGRTDIWYATNIEIVDYMKAFRQLQFSAALDFVYNPMAGSVWLNVDGSIVEAQGGARTLLVQE